MFEADGGVASVIRSRRLDTALRELSGPRRPSITELTLDLGFSSGSQFACAFRARFDWTPGAVAAGQIAPTPGGLAALRLHFADRATLRKRSARVSAASAGRYAEARLTYDNKLLILLAIAASLQEQARAVAVGLLLKRRKR
jgi:AraC-like DNA-binding protein